MAMATKQKREEKNKYEEKAANLDKRYLDDKKHAGLRPLSAGWGVFKTIELVMNTRFNESELAKYFRMWCQEQKLKVDVDHKVAFMLRMLRKMGIVRRIGKEEYEKMI